MPLVNIVKQNYVNLYLPLLQCKLFECRLKVNNGEAETKSQLTVVNVDCNND